MIIIETKVATKEQVEKARKFQLPDNFYLYESKEKCKGCRGCTKNEKVQKILLENPAGYGWILCDECLTVNKPGVMKCVCCQSDAPFDGK